MMWRREALRFGLVGVAQLCIELGVFVLTSAMGLPVGWANLVGRVSAAVLGFLGNAHYTFSARRSAPLDRAALMRFATLWSATTLLSTMSLAGIEYYLGLGTAWLLKPVVDGSLVLASFLINRHWVYR
jgi:putative flippase GtrA